MDNEYECTLCGFIFDELGECPECGASEDDVITHKKAEDKTKE
jgi:rubredoxin